MKAEKGSKCIDYSFFNLVAWWGWVVNTTLRPLCPQEGEPVSILQEDVWASNPVWTGA